MATLQHANPRFLEEVLRQFAVSGEVNEIAKKPMLILLNEAVQQVWIAPAETASNCARLGFHRIHEAVRCGIHATGYTGEEAKKTQVGKTSSLWTLSYSHSARYPAAG
jgi:hypothetical protein